MKNIHVLPTDKPSILYAKDDNYKLANSTMAMDWYISSAGYKPYNICITSDVADINENDYIITKDGRLVQVSYLLSKDLEGASKIILTTDQDLVKDGVQAIDDEFLEWFVKNSSCERVEVVLDDTSFVISDIIYKIIIPKEIGFKVENGKRTETFYSKEEPTIEEKYLKDELKKYDGIDVVVLNKPEEPKQETLEEFAKRIINENHFYNYKSLMQLVIMGAKWQQEQMYSEEDVRGMLEDMSRYVSTKEMRDDVVGIGYSEWVRKRDWFVNHIIEQFKNK